MISYIALLANACLLSYGIDTNPGPLQASPQKGDPQMGAITLVVSNNTEQPIYCEELTFRLPIGEQAQHLTSSAKGILAVASPSDKWQINNNNDGSFTAKPTKPIYNKITNEGLTFYIYNIRVNKKVGNFTFSVEEKTSTVNQDFQSQNASYQLAKFPAGFFVKDFIASTPMVENGQKATLTWTGSSLATYTILCADKSYDVTHTRTWTTPEPLHNTTTFFLKASMQEQGQTIETILPITVTVANPDLAVNSLQVQQNALIEGKVGIGTTNPSESLEVTGSIKAGSNAHSFYLKNGWNQDPTLVSKAKDKWLRIGSKHSIGFWANGKVEGDDKPQLFINEHGKVGIGTTSPSERLEVNGNIKGGLKEHPFYLKNGKYKDATLVSTAEGRWLRIGANGGIGLWADGQVESNSNPHFLIAKDGNIGIGTTNPHGKLQVGNNNKCIIMRDDGKGLDIESVGGPLCLNLGTKNPIFIGNGDLWKSFPSDKVPTGFQYKFRKLKLDFDHNTAAIWEKSDARLKKDIHPLTGALEKLLHLRGVSYAWNKQGMHEKIKHVEESVRSRSNTLEENKKVWEAEEERIRQENRALLQIGFLELLVKIF